MQKQENLLPTIFVILGATGDLMQRKLAPALFSLYQDGKLPVLFQVVGFSRDSLSEQEFRALIARMIRAKIKRADKKRIEAFVKFFRYQQGFFEDKKGYDALASAMGKQDGEWRVCANKLFYIAASPQFYETIFRKLAASGLTEPCSPKEGWTRVIVEKPFGKDLQTAQKLDKLLGKLFKEEQVYRIDHYLGKETVQNILAFRFSNSFLEHSWGRDSIEKIHIRLLEKKGVGARGSFYDGIGALRDVGQNHMLQLLALFCMNNPGDFHADAVRKGRADILRSLTIWKLQNDIAKKTKRGQYEGYRKERGVGKGSETETYFRIETYIQDARWKGVPVILESGKAMAQNTVEVTVTFRHQTPCLCPENKHYRNTLHYQIQPKEGIRISFWVKKPGTEMVLEEKDFMFDYKQAFGKEKIADAYEHLVSSVIRGDQTLFVSTQEVNAEWEFVDPIIRGWQKGAVSLDIYNNI
jgi:glucose-6-phosphate 1-dehydrogenase